MLIALLLLAQQPAPDPRIEPIIDYVLCTDRMTERYALQPEPAAIIADAVLGACDAEEGRFRLVLSNETPRLAPDLIDSRVAQIRESTRRVILAKIVEARLAHPRTNPR